MNLHAAPQIIVFALLVIIIANGILNDGEPLPHPEKRIRVSFGRSIFFVALWGGLMFWGGFWK